MVHWRVRLEGNYSDLQELEQILLGHDPTVVKEGSDFYLTSKAWNDLQDAGEVRTHARSITKRLDQAAYFHFRDTAPVTIATVVKIDDDGHKHDFIFGEAGAIKLGRSRARAISTVVRPDHQVSEERQEHPVLKIQRLAATHRTVADALKFLRNGDWISLYKAFEIVCDEVNGKRQITTRNWLSEKVVSRFTQTAQSREALGDDARHASRMYKPPKEPMTIGEARAAMRQLIQKWLDTL